MVHSICIIDNGIPIQQSGSFGIISEKVLDTNTLNFLLREEVNWTQEEESLKDLIVTLIKDKEHWDVSAFSHPKYFIESINNDLIRPEIIIYDWEFHTTSTGHKMDHESILFRILNESFSVVFIYSGVDKEDEIKELIKTSFKDFDNRVFYFNKKAIGESGEQPEEVLIKAINTLMDENFSFRFGTIIRQKSMESVDRILANLGKATLRDVSAYFKLTDDTKRDLIDFIGERFKSSLHGINLEELPEENEASAFTYNEEFAIKLWANRLYFDPGESDNVVRRGDIIYKDADGKDKLYLVISADCDLDRFWHKCFGKINLIPLIKIDSTLKEKLLKTVKEAELRDRFLQASLTSNINCLVKGPFVLPFIKINGDFLNYLVCPKDIGNINILPPEGLAGKPLKNERLKYDYWGEYRRILTVSEPFISPLIEHITKSLSGYGVPDFPPDVQKTIENISREAFK